MFKNYRCRGPALFPCSLFYKRRIAFIPAFLHPQSHSPTVLPPPALGQSADEARATGFSRRATPPSPAAHREDSFSSPVQTSVHISTTPPPLGRNRNSPGSAPHRTLWKPQAHRPMASWLGPPTPAPPHTRKIEPRPRVGRLPYLYNSDTPGTNIDCSEFHTAPHGVETPIARADH